jgi:hypothetical protein
VGDDTGLRGRPTTRRDLCSVASCQTSMPPYPDPDGSCDPVPLSQRLR